MPGHVVITAPEAAVQYVEQLVALLEDAGIPSRIYHYSKDERANEQMRESVETCAAVVAVMFEEPESAVGAVSLGALEHDKPIFPLRLGGRPLRVALRSAHRGRSRLRHAERGVGRAAASDSARAKRSAAEAGAKSRVADAVR